MKKVFEGMAWKLDSLGAWPTGDFAKIMVGFENHRVRITVEDLPESKPEKNCGNCAHAPIFKDYINANCPYAKNRSMNDPACGAWQPKAAEPEGWEQLSASGWKNRTNTGER